MNSNEKVLKSIEKTEKMMEELSRELTFLKSQVSGEPEKKEEHKSDTVFEEVSEILKVVGVPAHIRGHEYIRNAILLSLEDADLLRSITTKLYPEVAKKSNTTSSRTERAIRHAIERAWESGNKEEHKKLFGYTLNKSKPTNSEFLAQICDTIKREQIGA